MVKNVKNCFYQLTKAYETVIEEMKIYVRMLCVFKRIRSLSVSKWVSEFVYKQFILMFCTFEKFPFCVSSSFVITPSISSAFECKKL